MITFKSSQLSLQSENEAFFAIRIAEPPVDQP